MAIATYADLQAAIADELMRDDISTSAVQRWIAHAEKRIERELRISGMEVTAYASLVNGAVALPDDYLEFRRLIGTGNDTTPLWEITPGYAGGAYAWTTAGVPSSFTISGNILTTYPNGGTGQVTMIYYARPPTLSDTQTSNWLLLKTPALYLNAALSESAGWLADDTRMAMWDAKYERVKESLQAQDDRGRYAGAVMRVSGPTP